MPEIDAERLVEAALKKSWDCYNLGDFDYGIAILEELLRCDPEHKDATQLLGIFFWRLKLYDKAIPLFEGGVAQDPDNPENYNNVALCYSGIGKTREAIENLVRANELRPDEPNYLSNLGVQYRKTQDYGNAIAAFDRALRIAPENPNLWLNSAGVYGETKELDKAEWRLRKCLDVDPENANAHVDLFYTLALKGDYKTAWDHYEYRFDYFENLVPYKTKFPSEKRLKTLPPDLNDKTLMIYCEQGLGDTIHFCRYLTVLRARLPDCRITVYCSNDLVSMLASQPSLGIDEFFVGDIIRLDPNSVPFYDYHFSLMSLPFLLKKEDVPNRPYIFSKEKVPLGNEKFNIGIVWAGSPLHPNDAVRSCYVNNFKGIEELPGVRLWSFQHNKNPRVYACQPDEVVDYAEGIESMFLLDCSGFDLMEDFKMTAEWVAGLDLVVSVDTAVLHLAGAMGIPTIGLIAYDPDWRWGIEGEETVWYPSVKLIRQEKRDDWSSVFVRLKEEVEKRMLDTSWQKISTNG